MELKDIEKLLQLKKDNPNMEILFKCDESIYISDSEGTFMGTFNTIEKSFYAEYGEHIYLNEDDLKDYICYNMNYVNEGETEEKIYDKIKQEEKIIIHIGV